jgi:hypothetical protein
VKRPITVRELLLALAGKSLSAEVHAVTVRHSKGLVASLPVMEVRFQESTKPGTTKPVLLMEFVHAQGR